MKNVVLSPSMTGISSPDPLKFAFVIKDNAHSSRGGSHPITLDASQWKKWWSTPTSAKTRALYIHIPFCRKRCSFCSFFENGANPARISRYVEQLSKQLEIASQTPFIQSHKFDTVYVGGGTPTDIQPNEIAMIGDAIQKFPLIDGAEITLEGRINGFTDEKFNAALSAKFNRFSFGIQSFNTQVRKAAGRLDSREELISRIQQLSKHPTATIVADLIFGLPGQTMDIWQQDIKDIIESGAHGVDLYQLISLPGTRLSKLAEKEKLTLQNARKAKPNLLAPAADNQTRATMYAQGSAYLELLGWKRISNCHWQSDKREKSIYNSLAKSGIEIVPFGSGAGGSIHGHGMMNARNLAKWHQSIDAQLETTFPAQVPGMVLTPNLSSDLDCQLKSGLDHGQLILDEFDNELVTHLIPLFKAWQQNGLVKLNDRKLTLTLAGRFWNVNLLTGLFSYLKENPLNILHAEKENALSTCI